MDSPLVAMGHGGGDQGARDAEGLAGRGGELGELESSVCITLIDYTEADTWLMVALGQ